MNYYEELGVGRSASIAEIRQAYKALVRVLHPDQQQEENLRRLSELQLLRLNHMLQMLTDPVQRRQYDLSLDRLLPFRTPGPPQKLSLSEFRGIRLRLNLKPGVFVWLLIGAIAIGTGLFWMREPEPVYSEPERVFTEKPGEAVRKQAPAQVSDSHYPGQERSGPDVPARSIETTSAAPTYPGPRKPGYLVQTTEQTPIYYPERPVIPKTSRNDSPPSSPVKSATESVPADSAAATLTQPADPSPVPPAAVSKPEYSMSGKWLYVPRHDDTKKGMYPPEYIEMRITRQAGLLKGRYHATYKVSDRPISSEVNFQFEGRQGNPVALLPWFSSNGSRGELRLKRISDDSLEVNWITTSFGNVNTLASGTAILYRSDP
jgi:DnaJ domain